MSIKLLSQQSTSQISHLRCDANRKRKVSSWILGDCEETPSISMSKKLRRGNPNFQSKVDIDEHDEVLSCVTTTSSSSRVCLPPKLVAQVVQLKSEKGMKGQKQQQQQQQEEDTSVTALEEAKNLRAARLKSRFAETILRAQQKQGKGFAQTVDVQRYKLAAEQSIRREIQKQREAARKKLEDLEKSVVVEDNYKAN